MTPSISWQSKPDVSRVVAILLCVFVAMICLAYDHWRGDLPDWWRAHGGGIPYVLFWITLVFAFFPRRRAILPICIIVTTATCLLEFAQLWQPAWLTHFRATRFGAALLGGAFSWKDVPPYLVGGAVGCLLLARLPGRSC